MLQCWVVLATAFALALAAAGERTAAAAVRPLKPGRACERTQVRKLPLTGAAQPDILTVRATGASCGQAWIVVTVRAAGGRALWTDRAFLGAVESARLPGEAAAPEVTFEQVIAAVEGWVSVENTRDAPAWPNGKPTPASGQQPGSTQYDSPLDRARYERIRAAQEPMLCIPVGPEAAHCVAMDPASRRLVAFLGRGG
jgi:hypothetical protein